MNIATTAALQAASRSGVSAPSMGEIFAIFAIIAFALWAVVTVWFWLMLLADEEDVTLRGLVLAQVEFAWKAMRRIW